MSQILVYYWTKGLKLTGGSFEKKGILREIYINREAKIIVKIGTSGCTEIK